MRPNGERQLAFLNDSPLAIETGNVDWASPGRSRLWRYNLHYFDYIVDAGRSIDGISHLLDDWISSNTREQGEGWEAYPVSLRIVNWIKLFLRDDFRRFAQPAWLRSLYAQARWLEGTLEYDILGNHLLKNGKALLFAGTFFNGADAERWRAKGLRILVDQAREQILDDGGHFERSPMYHSIVVEDYLDALNVLLSCAWVESTTHRELLIAKTTQALDFLHGICLPDGSIPLFNDSAFGIARHPSELAEYAGRLFGYPGRPERASLHAAAYPSSGYFTIRNGKDMLVVDCGEVGPSYQPGHAHCDMLSYELVLDGHRIIVDSGVENYVNSESRRYVRSTRAHNTVMVDGCEQSEVWDAFRVGRRAHPVKAELERGAGGAIRFSGAHDGFRHLRGKPLHARTIQHAERLWSITDVIGGHGFHEMASFIHLHPELRASCDGRIVSVVADNQRVVCEIEVEGGCEIAMETGWYCPEFGRRLPKTVIRLSRSGELPLVLGYRIVKALPRAS